MINYIDVKKLGFKKVQGNDSVYEDKFGRPYWYMDFLVIVSCPDFTNEIIFIWDCDTRNVKVFRNEKLVESFEKFEELVNCFTIFTKQED